MFHHDITYGRVGEIALTASMASVFEGGCDTKAATETWPERM